MSSNFSLAYPSHENKRIRLLAIGLFLFCTAFCPPSLAHIGAPEGRAPFLDNQVLLGGGTTWGIIHRHESQWRRVCEESVGEPPNFWLHRADGRVLLGSSQGLLVTRDHGCTYDQVDENLAVHKVGTVALPDHHSSHIYIATASPGGNNAIYRSTDNGETFDISGLHGLDDFILSMYVTADEENLYASTYSGAQGGVKLYRSPDQGATFQESVTLPENALYVTIVGFRQASQQLVLSIIFAGETGGQLYFADTTLEEFTLVQAFSSVPTTFVEYETYEFVLLAFTQLVRRSGNLDGGTFESFEDPSARCILHSSADNRLWRCGLSYQFGHFLSSTDGEEWETHIPFLDVIEFQCPEGTIGASRCAYLFSDAGVSSDAGSSVDAGTIMDAGSDIDAGASTVPTDSGSSVVPPEDDAISCGCNQTHQPRNHFSSRSHIWFSTFGFVFIAMTAKRRRTNRA